MSQHRLLPLPLSLTKDPPEIPVGRVEVTPIGPVMSAALPSATVAGKHSRMLLWSIIVIVLLLLIFFSFRLMSAIPEKDKHDRL